tara:strand:+ start:639 stop:1577 length:939 start_codon:yes stop_codon:yes gene_type:complete
MAVPSSGQLRLYADIGVELGLPPLDVSLGSMSDSAGFASPDAMSDFYGYSSATAPSITTNTLTSIGETSMTANGNVTSDGDAAITERGFYFGTNSASPTNNTKYTVSGTTGAFSRGMGGLSTSSTYYCWAFATNSEGTTYGTRVAAATLAAFVPVYSPVTSNSHSSTGTIIWNDDSYQTSYRRRAYLYYRNPNTGGYISRGGWVENRAAYDASNISFTLTKNNGFPQLAEMATNTTNRSYNTHDNYGNYSLRYGARCQFLVKGVYGQTFSGSKTNDNGSYTYQSLSGTEFYVQRVWCCSTTPAWADMYFTYS